MRKLLFPILFGLLVTPGVSQITLGGGGNPTAYTDILSAAKAFGTPAYQTNEYVTVAGSATQNLLNYTGSGYVASFWMALSTSDANGLDNSTINVYYDGHSSPDISVSALYFFGAYGANSSGKAFITRYTSYVRGASSVTYQLRLPLPFSTGIKIDLVNGSTSSMTLFSQALYQTGVADSWTNTRHLYLTTFSQSACTLGSTVNLANIASGAGRIVGLSWYMSGGAANDQEGDFTYYTNGNATPILHSSGTEDFFETGFNWQGVWMTPNWSIAGGQLGVYVYSGSFPADPVGAFRFHIDDVLTFTNGFKLTWMCGDPSEGSSGNPNVNTTVWYYLQD